MTNDTDNRAPAFAAETATREVAENHADAAAVGAAVTATDADADTLTYSLSGTDAASFDIASGSGEITVKSGTTLDHEAKSSHEVTVGVTDGRDADGDAEETPSHRRHRHGDDST